MCPAWFRRRSKSCTIRSGESAEVNVTNHEYEVEHIKKNRPETPRLVGVKKKEKKGPADTFFFCLMSSAYLLE